MGIFGGGSKDTSRESPAKVVKSAAITAEWRPVFLLCYPSAKFKSHWAIFVPELQDLRVHKGKLIHVVGNVREGFELEFKRNYDLNFTNNPPGTPIELGLAPSAYLLDTIGENVYTADSDPKDYFEKMIASVPAPSKSLNTVQRDSVSVQAYPPPCLFFAY
jgi:hypothetical protein